MFVSAPNFVPWTKRSFRKPVIPRFTHFLLSAVENQVAGAVHFAQLAAYSTVRIWKCPESLQIGFDLRPADGNLFLGINRWKVSTNGPSMIKMVFSNFRSQFPDQLWQLYGRHMIYGYICQRYLSYHGYHGFNQRELGRFHSGFGNQMEQWIILGTMLSDHGTGGKRSKSLV